MVGYLDDTVTTKNGHSDAPPARTLPETSFGRAIVEVRDLRKVFPKAAKHEGGWLARLRTGRRPPETFVAVEGVSFDIREGEVFGLLGPNGAGKSTTIKMLSTLLEPTSGTATISGFDISREAAQVRQRLGAVLTGERSIYWKLTGRENLHYFAALYHLPPAIAKERVELLLARLELTNRADEPVERYSSGMKQRIAIAKALLANPPVVLLDEPTIGLDPQSARNLRELIVEIRAEGHTVLLTTHYMEEADQLCDRVGIIDQGRIIALDTPTALKRSIGQLEGIRVEVAGLDPLMIEPLRSLPGVEQMASHPLEGDEGWAITVHTADSRALLPQLIEALTQSGRIRQMHTAQPTLEDVFITLTGKQLRD